MVHRETPVVKKGVEQFTVTSGKTCCNRHSLDAEPLAPAMIKPQSMQRNSRYATEYDQKRLRRHILAATTQE
ncbi:hypothetical protein C4J97_4003 [Pseudomonas orientalis]|nr:hypothetical protein C4J97_4003 [Pseudomonas orientalis]